MLLLIASMAAAQAAVFQPSSGPSASPSIDTAAITRAVLDEMRTTRAPGVAIAVVSGGRIVYERGFGVESVEDGIPVTPATLFRIGSTTKMVTGLTALLLASRGSLRIDEPISRRVKGIAPTLGALTLHQLLSHSAGLVNAGAGMGPQDESALGRLVRGWGAEMKLAPPNDVYSYSSPGYWLAGHVIEEAGSRPYADVVRDLVLQPLGMTRSTFRTLMAMTYPLARDHRVYPESVVVVRPFPNDATTWASGSLFSSAHELARLTIALLNGGTVDGKQVFPAAVIESLTTARMQLPNSSCAYTYGLLRCSNQGRTTLSHSGFRGGSGSIISLVPEERFAVIVLSNRNGGIFNRTAAAAAAQLPAPRGASGAGEKPTAIDAASVAGVYTHASDSIRVVRRSSQLAAIRGTDTTLARFDPPSTLALIDSAGRAVEEFMVVRGRRTGNLYLHDGLEAYRKVPSHR